MKLGLMMALFGNLTFDKALDRAAELKLDAVEIGVGNYPGGKHCPLKELVKSKAKAAAWADKARSRGLEISALACHGNPLHPDPKFAAMHHQVWRDAVKLASMIGVDTVTGFSGCPGGGPQDKTPNWITCAWPPDFAKSLQWQWEKKLIPYWKKEAKYAADRGVRMAFEMHPGMSVFNNDTLRRLNSECGDSLGCNFDPSHLFWQGIDPLVSIRDLGKLIYHVHAKDTRIDPQNSALNGNLDIIPYGEVARRSWVFRTVGYGHGEQWWRDFVTTLRMVGYDGVISIEHEDGLMSVSEGCGKAIEVLRNVLLRDPPPQMWWA